MDFKNIVLIQRYCNNYNNFIKSQNQSFFKNHYILENVFPFLLSCNNIDAVLQFSDCT